MILDAYLKDTETSEIISDAAFAAEMLRVEAALARVQSRAGIIPLRAGERISIVASELTPNLEELVQGTLQDGVPVIALVHQLRKVVGEDFSKFVHWGVTSQDIIDTAMAMILRRIATLFLTRLDNLVSIWAVLLERYRTTIMVARTRSQHAVPTTFGLKIAGWIAPLLRHRARLEGLSNTTFAVQLGGGGGTLSVLGGEGFL